MTPEQLFSLLSDSTRLRSLALLAGEGELCVCELTEALDMPQPKISRHLALLRDAGLVHARREGIWIHYRIAADLPAWAKPVLDVSLAGVGELDPFAADRVQLALMSDRPGGRSCD
ncbi:MAG: metalloregulator ArsR/SmtB family transcription factor [Xanthomonadales bacterium]|nr:metalloregulator ArsR/SmtB family transcription factor [Xanthomonadales bacterium]